jgi:hypothetical protein
MRYVWVFFVLMFSASCSAQGNTPYRVPPIIDVPQKTAKPNPSNLEPFTVEDLHSEFACQLLRQEALNRGCISYPQMIALEYMRAAPTCDDENRFLKREQCFHPTLRAVQKILYTVERPCTEDGKQDVGGCARESVYFTKKSGRRSSLGKRILIQESFLRSLAFTRYKSRVLDYVVPDMDGTYYTTTVPVKIPKALITIWSDLLDEHDPLAPSFSFSSVGSRFSEVFQDVDGAIGHGVPILNKLAEAIPHAEFVIAETDEATASLYLCDLEGDLNAFERLKNFIGHSSKSLIEKIKENRVDFINMSRGLTLNVLQKQVARYCEGKTVSNDSLLKALALWTDHFYLPLSAIPDVVLVQAGTHAHRPLQFKDSEYLVDCTPMPNRIRIGPVDSPGNKFIPKEGINDYSLLSPAAQNALECNDLFVMGGRKSLEMSSSFSSTSLDHDTLFLATSSWLTPVALAYLVQLKDSMPFGTSVPDLIASATNNGKGRIKDPARHELDPMVLYSNGQ